MTETELVTLNKGYQVLSLYHIEIREDQSVIDQHGKPFDTLGFSRLKHGCTDGSEPFGFALGAHLLSARPELLGPSRELYIMSSAYRMVQVPARRIAASVHAYVTMRRFGIGALAPHSWKIHRKTIFEGDYSGLSEEERNELMARNELYIDSSLLEGLDVIIVDDVRVTGKHEKNIWANIGHIPMRSCTFLYLVEVDPISANRVHRPERFLNRYHVKSLDDLANVIETSRRHVVTTGTIKFILESEDFAELEKFLDNRTHQFLREFVLAIVKDGYYAMKMYQKVTSFIIKYCQKRGVFTENYSLVAFS